MIRREIRGAGLFLNEEPQPVLMIEGTELDHGLSDIKHAAKENYEQYKEDYCENKKYGFNRDSRKPVFITKDGRDQFNQISSKTKEFIVEEFFLMLKSMPDQVVATDLQKSLGNAPQRFKKAILVEKYNEIADLLEMQNASMSVCEMTGDTELLNGDNSE